MTSRQRAILAARLTAVVVVSLVYLLLAYLDFHPTVVGPIAVVLIIVALFVPVPGSKDPQPVDHTEN